MSSDQVVAKLEQRIDTEVLKAMDVGGKEVAFTNMGEVMEFARLMAVAGSAVPKHLRGQPGACLGVIDDAMRFQMSPYALARKSYFVNDNLAYESQVITAIILRFAPLKQRPEIEYLGEGKTRQCRVRLHFLTGEEREYVSPTIGTITPQNSPLWKSDPDQQLAYYSMRAAARRYCPDVLLGIYDLEEIAALKARDVTPTKGGQSAVRAALAGKDESAGVDWIEDGLVGQKDMREGDEQAFSTPSREIDMQQGGEGAASSRKRKEAAPDVLWTWHLQLLACDDEADFPQEPGVDDATERKLWALHRDRLDSASSGEAWAPDQVEMAARRIIQGASR